MRKAIKAHKNLHTNQQNEHIPVVLILNCKYSLEILKVQLHDGTFNRKKLKDKKKSKKLPVDSEDEASATLSQYSFHYSGVSTESSQESADDEVTFCLVPGTLISF